MEDMPPPRATAPSLAGGCCGDRRRGVPPVLEEGAHASASALEHAGPSCEDTLARSPSSAGRAAREAPARAAHGGGAPRGGGASPPSHEAGASPPSHPSPASRTSLPSHPRARGIRHGACRARHGASAMSAMSATALLAALLVGWACAVVDVAPPCPAEADRADGLVDASRQLLKARRDAEAAACLEKAYAASPSYLPALVESASAAARGGDHALAVQRYKLALKQEIAPATLNNLAIAHQAMDHHEEAVAAYRRALRFDEDDPSAYYNLGTALEKAGEYKLAVRAYKSAIDLEPEEAKYYSNMGGSLAAMNRTETAERSYKWAIKLSPKFADAYYNLGNLLLGTGKVELAIDRLEAALKLQPTHEKAIKKLADAKQELENKVAAFKVEVDQAIDKAQKMMNRGEI